METKKVLYIIILILTITSCSNKLNVKNINKPFYRSFEKGVRKSYEPYQELKKNDTITDIPSFKNYYNNSKFEIDLIANFRAKVIDSLGLLKKDNWLLITEYGSGFTGPYEQTFIIYDNKYVQYTYTSFNATMEGVKTSVYEEDINTFFKKERDISEIYKLYKDEKRTNKLDLKGYSFLSYKIHFIKNKKIKSYKMTSQDYILRKW